MTKVIAMLTNDDLTVADAEDVYAKNKQAKTLDWGFKDNNMTLERARLLGRAMQNDGKIFYFESLAASEANCIEATKMALELKPDCFTALEYSSSVHKMLSGSNIKFFPTCGRRAGYPRRMLYGTIEEIIADANRIIDKGVDGVCLSVFRYEDGDPIELAKRFVSEVKAPTIISGSINSDARLDFIREVRPWGFTVGSSLFQKDFGENRTIAEQLDYISDYIAK